jgi:hypothetical protein
MTEHDFGSLYAQYPTIIAQMPETFTNHQFILVLQHQKQIQYIETKIILDFNKSYKV